MLRRGAPWCHPVGQDSMDSVCLFISNVKSVQKVSNSINKIKILVNVGKIPDSEILQDTSIIFLKQPVAGNRLL